jgi:hypothetical protein
MVTLRNGLSRRFDGYHRSGQEVRFRRVCMAGMRGRERVSGVPVKARMAVASI